MSEIWQNVRLLNLIITADTLAWKIPWTEEPGRLQSMGSLRVAHDWATSFSLFTFMHWRRKWQPTPMFSPGESQGWGSLVGCRLWVTQSRTRLKWLSNLYLCDFFHQLFSDYDNFILSGISVYIFQIPLHYKILNLVPCAIEEVLVVYLFYK